MFSGLALKIDFSIVFLFVIFYLCDRTQGGSKSMLLISSKYVNKTEKTGGT